VTLDELIREEHPTISVERAAEYLSLGRSLAYRLAKSGELPGVRRFGRLYRVSVAELRRSLGIEEPPS
jgi:excisionase family DNA binding protein